MTYEKLIEEQKLQTREIIASLLDDGSCPDALYTIEHHLSGNTFAELEVAAVEAFKLGFDVQDAQELELDDGGTVICFDVILESALDAERIDEEVEKLITLAQKHKIDYDGWGTYFESDEDDEDEEGDEGDDLEITTPK